MNEKKWIALDNPAYLNGEPVLLAVWGETYRDMSRGREVRAFTKDEALRLYDQGELVGWTPHITRNA